MDSQAEIKQDVFVVFQGGGAKGIAHLGGIKALEEVEDARIAGVAGTSAGAIVAALVAAGYKAEEIFSTNGDGDHLLKRIDKELSDATKLFGESGWRRLKRIENAKKWADEVGGFKKLAACIWLSVEIRLALWTWAVISAAITEWALLPRVWMWSLLLFLVVPFFYIRKYARPAFRSVGALANGLTDTKKISVVINKALIEQLRKAPPLAPKIDANSQSSFSWDCALSKDLTFADFERMGGRPLRIVATDLTNKDVEMFSAHTTPATSVAEAVCASIGLPFVFEVKSIEHVANGKRVLRSYMDGGLLSNLPLWVFDEDRLLAPSVPTVAFSLGEASESAAAQEAAAIQGLGWLMPAVNAIVGGPSRIHRRNVEGLVLVRIPTGLGVLAFAENNGRYCCEVQEAYTAAREQLLLQFQFPRQLQKNLYSLRRDLINAFELTLEESNKMLAAAIDIKDADGAWDIDVSIAVQRWEFQRVVQIDASTYVREGARGARAKALRFENSGAAAAWTKRGPDVFQNPDAVVPGTRWQIAVPIRPSHEEGEQVRPFQNEKLAVVLLIESQWLRDASLDNVGDFTEAHSELLISMGFAAEKVMNTFGIAFKGEMEEYMKRKGATEKVSVSLEFCDQAREARLWQ
jgi:predicted acylesterase/phospholipase RssA